MLNWILEQQVIQLNGNLQLAKALLLSNHCLMC